MRSFLQKLRYTVGPYKEGQETEEQLKVRDEYLKSIMTFVDPKTNDMRIGKNLDGIEEYDLVKDSDGDKLLGRMSKRFVRVHKGYFSKFFELVQKKKGKCSVESYLNNQEIAKGELLQQNVSALLKKIKREGLFDFDAETRKMNSEMVAPALLDFFGCKTVFNTGFQQGVDFYVMSLDFIKPDEFFYLTEPVETRNPKFALYTPMETALKVLEEKVEEVKQRVVDDFKITPPSADVEQIKRRYVKDYLVRFAVMGDSDFTSRNHGFVFDAIKNNVRTGPNFDFEFIFEKRLGEESNVGDNLKYIIVNYPDVFQEVMQKVEDFIKVNPKTQKPVYEEIISEYVSDPSLVNEYCKSIQYNTGVLKTLAKKYEKELSENQPQ